MKDVLLAFLASLSNVGDGLSLDSLQFSSDEPLAMMTTLMKYLSIAGMGLTLVYFLMELNQKLVTDGRDLNIKSFAAPFLKLFVAVVLLSHGASIMQGAIAVNNGIVEAADGAATTALEEINENPYWQALEKMVNEGNFWTRLLLVLPLFTSWILNTVLGIVWYWKAVTYKIEFVYRVGIAPIAFADVYNGLSSTAVRYVKGFIAFGVYGAALILLPRISVSLASDVVGSITLSDSTIWDCIKGIVTTAFLAPFAAISVASAAKSAAREALGA